MKETIRQKTAQQIVDTVKDVCGQDINFIGEKGIILASTDASRVNTFHEIGKQVIMKGTIIEVAENDSFYGTHKGVNIPITHNGNIVAAIGISGDPENTRKYAYLAQRITLLILREQDLDYQSNSRKNKLNYIMRSLINNDTLNHVYFSEFLSENHLDKQDSYCTILIALESRYNPNNLSMIEQKIYQTFDMVGSKLYTFQHPNEYVAFLKESDSRNRLYMLEQLADACQDILKIGVGSLQSLLEQHRSYQTAKLTLKSLAPGQTFAKYEDLDLELILGDIPSDTRNLFLTKVLGYLTAEDLNLLKAYYEENMSLLHTCERLFLHKNTLQYRLDRIARISGYNPRSFRDAAILYYALKLND